MKNIVLVGFMGTGKSVVARRLARRLDMKFISSDDIIEEKEGRKIAEIFEKSGEPYFRKIEKEITAQVSGLDGAVIATGGGVVLDEENITALKKNGVVICLNADPQTIYERTKKHKHRPILNVERPIDKINELLQLRAPFYARADHQVETTGKSVDQVVSEIIKIYNG